MRAIAEFMKAEIKGYLTRTPSSLFLYIDWSAGRRDACKELLVYLVYN